VKEMNSPLLEHNQWLMFFVRAGTWLLLLTNFVPISLIVTFEMVKFIQAYFMEVDADMVCPYRGHNATV
jgi:phospholipid-transporting ATPase